MTEGTTGGRAAADAGGGSPRPLVFHLIAHTHWDREWYLTRAAFVARLVPAVDDLIERLERDPAYRTFLLDGQTIHLEDYLQVRPDMRQRTAALVAAGRLQAGPWYVLADEQIPSAESLIRNLLIGATQSEALGGRLGVLYSPDAFGHPAEWPLIGAQFGLRYGALWRGLGDIGSDLVRWRGADRSELLVYHFPPGGYEVGAGLPADRGGLAEVWPPVRTALTAHAATEHVAVPVGADHHAAHPALPALAAALRELEPGAEVRISRLDEFMAAAERSLAERRGAVPVVEGELRWSGGYTWSLQGVHGTRAHQKRRNARAELLLERTAEPLCALARWRGGYDRRPLLAAAWRALVRSQFHDTLGGCCADPVARTAERRWDDVMAMGGEIARAAAEELVGHDADAVREGRAGPGALLLWNPAARTRSGDVIVAELTGFSSDVLVGSPGGRSARTGSGVGMFGLRSAEAAIPVQLLWRGDGLERRDAPHHYPDLDRVETVRVAFRTPALGGLEFARLEPAPAVQPSGDVTVSATGLANEHLVVRVAEDGTLRLTDRSRGTEWPGLLRLESEGDQGDTYTPSPDGRVVATAGPVAVRVTADGPLLGALEIQWRLELPTGHVGLHLGLQLRAGDPLLRCALQLDNRATDHRLRLRLPLGLAGVSAVTGGQLASTTRSADSTPDASPIERWLGTAPAHRYAGAADRRGGLALLAPGFFESEWTAQGDLLFTVLRAVGQLSRGDLPTRAGHAGWATATPEAQVLGADRLEFALLPVSRQSLEDRAAMMARWEDAFLPVRPVWYRESTSAEVPPGGIELQGDGLVFSACKPAEDGRGIILRCCGTRAAAVEGHWILPTPAAAAELTRADESPGIALPLSRDGREVRFEVPAGGLVTVRVVGREQPSPTVPPGSPSLPSLP